MSTSKHPSLKGQPPYITGIQDRVLFLTDDHNGLSNVHLAATFALLENHPHVKIHYGSFPKMAKELERIHEAASKKQPNAPTVSFHELPEAGWVDSVKLREGHATKPYMAPGVKGLPRLMKYFDLLMAPWSNNAHLNLYRHISDLIQDLDPAVVVLDQLFIPALDAATTLRRTRAIVSPNAIADAFVLQQPRLGALWKYPAITSGFPYPLPWSKLLENVYIVLRLAWAVGTSKELAAKKKFLADHGVQTPLQLDKAKDEKVPWIAASFPECGPPLEYIPDHVLSCGPIVLDVAHAETQDAELAMWLKRAPTLLINLGKSVRYRDYMARSMLEAVLEVLDRVPDVQILWKYVTYGDYDADVLFASAQAYVKEDRLRMVNWLTIDPTSILQTGDVAVSVHHGGANCFYETTLAGVPQVILPLWFDLYDYASRAEQLGIGVWPSKETAPEWDSKALAKGFLQALTGSTSEAMRQKSKAVASVAASYGGRETAARKIAAMAAEGHRNLEA